MKKSLLYLLVMATVIVSCSKSDDDDDNNDPAKIGLVGEWYSAGTDIAPLLAYLQIDSIYAKFNSDNTYLVESFVDGAKTTMTGTFVQTKQTTGTIWAITLNQSTPNTLTSVGIFEVNTTTSPFSMQYEVAQTEPVITGVTPPTVAAGFGSTSGGAYGQMNIQKYKKIVR